MRASIPACGNYQAVSAGGSAKSFTITLYAVVPDVAHNCGGVRYATESISIGPLNAPGAPPPVVSPSTLIEHGPLGPISVVS